MILPKERSAEDRAERLSNLTNLPLEWVRNLPEVGYPITKQLGRIRDLVDQARECERQAALLRTNAYLAALRLEGDLGQRWTPEEITKARERGA
ncbi:MAG: stable inheritance protein KleA [Ramlibacter sp.]|nr:stable inheritance protein KleA [Ramlibacter sp.]